MTFSGHKNWNHWNVSLWISNDEPLYRAACEYLKDHTKDETAHMLLEDLRDNGAMDDKGNFATPDGAPWTFTTIRAALRGWDD
jgi:hypothetical protein